MDPQSFVHAAVLLLVVAATAVALFRHFGLASILGLLVAGMLIGPHTPGPTFTAHVEDRRHFTELGVVLLLFVIGLEREIATRHGQTAFSVLLLQDLAVGPMLALMPVTASDGTLPMDSGLWEKLGLIGAMLALVAIGGRWLVHKVLDLPARQSNREAFFLVVMAAVFVAAGAMDLAGTSMAPGAFLMGLMLSESRYSVLGQAGEFGFILFGTAKALGIIGDRIFIMAVTLISISMLLTPLLVRAGNRLALDSAPERRRWSTACTTCFRCVPKPCPDHGQGQE